MAPAREAAPKEELQITRQGYVIFPAEVLAWLSVERAFFSASAAIVGQTGPRETLWWGCCKDLVP